MRRREFFALLGGATVWPLAAHPQRTDKVWRIGFLAAEPPTPAMFSAFRDGMREHGYIEGKNLSIDARWPQGSIGQNPGVATELVRSNVDVIVAWATPAVIAARSATSTIPIVMVSVGDPVGSGFVASLAHPGGNITGVSNIAPDLIGKLVELLVEIVPDIKLVGVVRNPDNPGVTTALRQTEAAIRTLGLRLEVVEARAAEEFESAFARLNTLGVKGVVLVPDPSLIEHAERIAGLAQKTRLPTIFERRENAEVGGLLSYGANLSGQCRQAADYVHRILTGEKPADLPVQLPTKYELVINVKTAKALGLNVPASLLARADEVIE